MTETPVEDIVEAVASVHAEHDEKASVLQRVVNRVVVAVGRPAFAIGLTVTGIAWVNGNLYALWHGHEPWDPPPFAWLSLAASLIALFTTLVILATQRHDDRLARHREMLTLEIVLLTEQNTAKIIARMDQLWPVNVEPDHRPHDILNALSEAHREI